jgi:hypothetical protein
MALRYLRKSGVILLIAVAGGMLAVGGAWAAHDCCGHPSGDSQTTEGGTENSSPGDDCVCTCCQAEKGISLPPGLSPQIDSWWSVEISSVFPVSRFETDIFRPPLA